MMNKAFATDPTYKQMTQAYGKKDAFLAIGVYACVILLYLGAGYLRMTTGSTVPSILANVLLIALVFLLVRIRGQKLSTVGFTMRNFKRSLIVGTGTGLVLSICANVIPGLLSGGRWVGLGEALWNLFYMLVIIAFMEELVFRGYIQTRLYGAIKSDAAAVVVCGLLFAGMHIPFQLFNRSGGDLAAFLSENGSWLLSTFVIHIAINFLYRKYNSLVAPTAFHFLVNFGQTLLR